MKNNYYYIYIVKMFEVFTINNINIIIFINNKDILFIAKPICDILEYKNNYDALKDNVNKEHKIKFKNINFNINVLELKKYFKIRKDTDLIYKKGLISLIKNSKKNNDILNNWLNTKYNLNLIIFKRLTKETEIINNIKKVFYNEEIICQYHITKFFIDMYFPKYKLAIEIDENGHNDRPINYDKDREYYIKKEINCVFLRCNPDDKLFNIFEFIGKIYKYISEYK
jgi:very-short-patch-repair endonuclease